MSVENGWHEYQKLVLAELKRLDSSVQSSRKELSEMRIAIEVLRNRAVTWGALGGIVVWLTTLMVGFFTP
jgi:hypothetical protein|tara:strand:- start:5452 stop:5661 length:210 start_codon:yes stop_codon:yes gene_type:complete